MLSVDEALAPILGTNPKFSNECIAVRDGLGRISGEVRSLVNLPPWPNSSMDGYAVISSDLTGATPQTPIVLRLLETIPAGGWPTRVLERGCASVILTGAPLPDRADAVVKIEDTDGRLEGIVSVYAHVQPGESVRPTGQDICMGQSVIEPGTRLTASHLGLLSAVGHTQVMVSRKPRIGILGTGNELVRPGTPLTGGQIWSANHASLAGVVDEAGGIPIDLGDAPDDFQGLQAAFQTLPKLDALLTSGGVSVGSLDFVKAAIEATGGRIDFWRVWMKPGKPLAFGEVGGIPLFALPGNPVSCLVNFLLFVRPWIRTGLGDRHPWLPRIPVVAGADITEQPGRPSYVRVRVEIQGSELQCFSAGGQGSAVLSAMARANGLLELPANSCGLKKGESGKVLLFGAMNGIE